MLESWCADRKNKLMMTLIFGRMVVTKERLNEKGSYFFVEWLCANKRNKSVGTLSSVQMVVHIASAKIPERAGSISPSSFYRQLLDHSSHFLSLIYSVDEFFLKEMRACVSQRFHLIVFVFSVNQKNQEAEGVQYSLV